MNLKKITALILCLILCLPLCACGGAKKADADEVYTIYTGAEANTNILEKYSAEQTMKISADFGDGTDMSVDMTAAITADIPAATYSQTMTYEYPGYGSTAINFYHTDNTTYYASGADKYKLQEADEDAIASVSNIAAFALPKKAFNDATLEKKDGVTHIAATAKGEVVGEGATQFLAAIDQYLEVSEPIEYTLSDVKIKIDVEDDYLTLMSLTFSADFDYEGNAAKADAEVVIAYTDVSGNAEPVPMDGYLDFPYYEEYAAGEEEKEGEAIDAAFALFEEDHQTKVENYDELYAEACEKYGKDMMDSIIELIVMFGSVN
ncbi:MAG: hypothetical protein IJC50_03795 [Clostridia bacterium]|nr:hypothetical protein [Clostridia bacterium]